MGRGDNRRSLKHCQRRGWRRKKMRLRKKIEEAQAAKKGVAPIAPAAKK
jgi:hypothetical protein